MNRRNTSAAHALRMSEYYAAREAWQRSAENATNGYAAEMREYRAANPAPTLKAFLTGGRR